MDPQLGIAILIAIILFLISRVYTRVLTRVQLTFRSQNRVPIHQWMWVESTRFTIRVGGVHTGGESGLNPG